MIEKRLVIGLLIGLICAVVTPAFASVDSAPVLSVISLENGDIQLDWTASAFDGIFTTSVSYDIEQSLTGDFLGEEIIVSASNPSLMYFDTGLTDGTVYFYRVVPIADDSGRDVLQASNIVSSVSTFPQKKHGGGDRDWATKPTFGKDYNTNRQLVTDGFGYGDSTITITDNFHTPFNMVRIPTGEPYSFYAKGYFANGIRMQVFCFGVPEVGKGDMAESCVEITYENGNPISANLVQKTGVLKLVSVRHDKIGVQDKTTINVVFDEPLKSRVMMIQGIDMKRRSTETYLNEGFDVSGKQFTSLPTALIASPVKGEGLIKVTESEKYSKIWIADNGRKFERNSYGTFNQVDRTYVFHTNPTLELKQKIADEAKSIFDSGKIQKAPPSSYSIQYPEEDHRTQFLVDHNMLWLRG